MDLMCRLWYMVLKLSMCHCCRGTLNALNRSKSLACSYSFMLKIVLSVFVTTVLCLLACCGCCCIVLAVVLCCIYCGGIFVVLLLVCFVSLFLAVCCAALSCIKEI